MDSEYLLEMINISKTYPGVKALNNVSFKLRKGSVHVLVGENGAGKSTLMKSIAGLEQPDEGNILIRGEKVRFSTPRESLKMGISMIHQELSPVPEMTIAENLFLGRQIHFKGTNIIDYKKMNEQSKELLLNVGLKQEPHKKMQTLTVAETQMVEIAKAISYHSEIIIMDEPSSAITDREVDILFKIINDLRKQGRGIIYISHKMDEIFRIADDITVLRDGEYIGTYPATEINDSQLIKKMVDRELKEIFPTRQVRMTETIFSVRNLTLNGVFKNISFDVRSGEILGIAGLMGAGRTEVVESIFGIRKLDQGDIFLKGEKIRIKRPKDAIRLGLALITEDRKRQGLIMPLSVKENLTLSFLKRICWFNFLLDRKKECSIASEYIELLKIKTPHLNQLVETLSGGNQQKVVIGKWLMMNPKILILDEPTRGIDIGAKTEIYHLMKDLSEQGVSIIFISSELPEIIGMSDRIIVFHEGGISGELNGRGAMQEEIMKYATGLI